MAFNENRATSKQLDRATYIRVALESINKLEVNVWVKDKRCRVYLQNGDNELGYIGVARNGMIFLDEKLKAHPHLDNILLKAKITPADMMPEKEKESAPLPSSNLFDDIDAAPDYIADSDDLPF